MTDAGYDAVVRELAVWPLLSADEQGRLLGIAEELLQRKTWEAAQGFHLDDEMLAVLAALAALPVLELGVDHYRLVSSLIVHPSTVTLPIEHPGPSARTVSSAPLTVHGLAQGGHGPVVLAWDQALAGARRLLPGHNVVLHELAHKLDMLNGAVDGTPALPAALRRDWDRVCQDVFADLVAGVPRPPMRWYGATNPAEFFAVATEVFFDQPHELAWLEPRLYGLLTRYYRQQPAAREPRPVALTAEV